MSVVSLVEYVEGRTGSETIQKVVAGWARAERKYKRVFVVLTDDADDGPATVLAAAGLPTLGTAYSTPSESDAGAFVQGRTPNQDPDNPLVWRVDIEYNSHPVFDFNENPFLRAPIFTFSSERQERFVRVDRDGTAIQNSAKQPLDPPLSYMSIIPVIKITINKLSFSYPLVATIQDCINISTWQGFAPRTVLASLEVKQLREGIYVGWTFDWILRVKYDGWNPTRVLDAGWYSLRGTAGSGSGAVGPQRLTQNRDAWGQPLSQQSPLDGTGHQLPPNGIPVYLEFDFYRELEFNGLIP